MINTFYHKLGAVLIVVVCLFSAIVLTASAPVVLNPTDLLSNSRVTINSNFLGLYNGSSGLIDCSGVAGRFVLTLNGGGTLPICGTLTWSNITALSGFPGVVTTWNGRANAVTLTAADVAGVEQDLRVSASPTFAGGTFNGAVSANGVTSNYVSGNAAFIATGSGAALDYSGGSNPWLIGSTSGHYIINVTTADGTCTMRGDEGLNCTGTQQVLATSSPTFAGVTITPTISASLPTCNTGATGTVGYVTDANASTWGSILSGSGSNHVGVQCNGVNWTIYSK